MDALCSLKSNSWCIYIYMLEIRECNNCSNSCLFGNALNKKTHMKMACGMVCSAC